MPPSRKLSDRQLDQILRMVHIFFRRIKLSDICREFNVPERTLTDAFKRRFGMRIARYISMRKIELSKLYLMRYPRDTCTKVGKRAGFKSKAMFFQAFKAYVGVNPREYRKNPTRTHFRNTKRYLKREAKWQK